MNPAGQTPEFVQLLTGSQSRLFALICTLLPGGEGVNDVLQETNIVLWERAGEYDPTRPFIPWAFQVARFQVLAYKKKQSRGRLMFDNDLIATLAEDMGHEPIGTDCRDDRLEALERCLQQLPARQRAILDRRYSDGEEVSSIARSLGVSAEAIAAQLYRIRKSLWTCIQGTLTR